jgi:hypothetical protein
MIILYYDFISPFFAGCGKNPRGRLRRRVCRGRKGAKRTPSFGSPSLVQDEDRTGPKLGHLLRGHKRIVEPRAGISALEKELEPFKRHVRRPGVLGVGIPLERRIRSRPSRDGHHPVHIRADPFAHLYHFFRELVHHELANAGLIVLLLII